jgi:hypothetical protein
MSASIRSSSNLGQLVIPESIVECSDYLCPLLLTSWGNTHGNVCLLMSILGSRYEKWELLKCPGVPQWPLGQLDGGLAHIYRDYQSNPGSPLWTNCTWEWILGSSIDRVWNVRHALKEVLSFATPLLSQIPLQGIELYLGFWSSRFFLSWWFVGAVCWPLLNRLSVVSRRERLV